MYIDPQIARFLTLVSGLGLELKGLRMTRGKTCYAMLKADYGFTGSRAVVFEKATAAKEAMIQAAKQARGE